MLYAEAHNPMLLHVHRWHLSCRDLLPAKPFLTAPHAI